ncbi:MAG: pyridoxal-phosphate dependent enzyme, partial [Verrucomicrobia bacterium]|nr:pyridoxal-phosphate dependent enzyme [Verrucomicrobiota bacterium]
LASQFDNPANPEVHRRTTAEEIWHDTEGQVDIFVAAVGTGGTITGVGEVLKSRNPNVKIVAVEPAGSPVLSAGRSGPHRIQGIGAGFVPAILNRAIIDEIICVKDEDAAETSCGVNLRDGIPVGLSSGAAIWAALQLGLRSENEGKRILAIVPSCSERYLSTWLFSKVNIKSDELIIENGVLKA